MSRALIVDTTGAPGTLVIDTEAASRSAGGYMEFTAHASGTVRFTYTVSGNGAGFFAWGKGVSGPAPTGKTTNLVSEPTEVVVDIEAGETFAFQVSAMGNNDVPSEGAQRRITITEFWGPEGVTEIVFDEQPASYRLAPSHFVTLQARTSRDFPTPDSFQWELNGVAIPGATNSDAFDRRRTSLPILAGEPMSTNEYRAIARSGPLTTASSAAQIVTVPPPTERGLLIHLTFEESEQGHFADAAGNRPIVHGTIPIAAGRVGRHSARFTGGGYLRIPAAATELELVGSSFTMACWMRVETNAAAQNVFRLGETLSSYTGYFSYWEAIEGRVQLNVGMGYARDWRGSGTILGDGWQHCAAVYDHVTGRLDLFTNGVLARTTNMPAPVAGTGKDDLLIGSEFGGAGGNGVTLIDDLRIYNYVVPVDEIAQLSQSPMPPPALTASAPSAGWVTIGWPADYGSEFVLESTTSMAPDGDWATVSDSVRLTPEGFRVTERSSGIRYFRLRKR